MREREREREKDREREEKRFFYLSNKPRRRSRIPENQRDTLAGGV